MKQTLYTGLSFKTFARHKGLRNQAEVSEMQRRDFWIAHCIGNIKIGVQKSLNRRKPVKIPEGTFAIIRGLKNRSEAKSKETQQKTRERERERERGWKGGRGRDRETESERKRRRRKRKK